MPLCTYFNRIVSLYLAKMYELSFGDKQMSRVPKFENFWDTLYQHQKWYCLQISYVLDMVDNDSEVPNFPAGFPSVGHFLRHPVQLSIDRNKRPLCTYFNRIVCLYLAKMYEWSFGDKQMSRVPKCGHFWDTLYHRQKWYCLQISYVLDMVDNDSLGAKN